MSRWIIIALAACSSAPVAGGAAGSGTGAAGSPIIVIPPGHVPEGHVWVIGFARNAKAGAIVDTGELPVYCGDRQSWPDALVGRPMIVDGTLHTIHHGKMVGSNGERDAGIEGDQRVVTPSNPPPAADDGLQDAERAVAAAIARHDRAALEQIIAPSFALHINGKTRTRAEMIAAVVSPDVESVEVTELASHRAADTGIVSGLQTAKVRSDGKLEDDRDYFVDVFARQGDRWILTAAFAAEPTP